jgi:hypothetical protein
MAKHVPSGIQAEQKIAQHGKLDIDLRFLEFGPRRASVFGPE